MTVEEILQTTVKAIVQLREQTNSPIHAMIYGKWGTGKTYAAKKIKEAFYLKVPEGQLSKSRLIKIFALSLGCGYRNLYEGTLDLMRYHILEKSIRHCIFILDEGQRILKNSSLLAELKDLSEDESLRFSYIFLGDHQLPKIYQANPHSLHKRILIKKELEPLTIHMLTTLAKSYKLQLSEKDMNIILNFGKQKGYTTIDIAFIFSYLGKVNKIEISEETLQAICKKLGL